MIMRHLILLEGKKPSKDSILLGKLIFPAYSRALLALRLLVDKLRAAVVVLLGGKGVTGHSGSWVPGAETDCPGSTSCTELSQWSNYWKWSVWDLEKCPSFKVTLAASEPYPAPAQDCCMHLPTRQLPPGQGGGDALSVQHLNSCKHKFSHQPAGRVLFSAEDLVHHICSEKQHLLQGSPMHSLQWGGIN